MVNLTTDETIPIWRATYWYVPPDVSQTCRKTRLLAVNDEAGGTGFRPVRWTAAQHRNPSNRPRPPMFFHGLSAAGMAVADRSG